MSFILNLLKDYNIKILQNSIDTLFYSLYPQFEQLICSELFCLPH